LPSPDSFLHDFLPSSLFASQAPENRLRFHCDLPHSLQQQKACHADSPVQIAGHFTRLLSPAAICQRPPV